jgi:hypothetical protein
MTVRLPSDFQTYNTAADITNTSAVVALPSLTSLSQSQYCMTELSVSNTSATGTVLRVLGNAATKFNVPAPANSGAIIKFDPALAIGPSEALRIQSKASAELEVSIRAYVARL